MADESRPIYQETLWSVPVVIACGASLVVAAGGSAASYAYLRAAGLHDASLGAALLAPLFALAVVLALCARSSRVVVRREWVTIAGPPLLGGRSWAIQGVASCRPMEHTYRGWGLGRLRSLDGRRVSAFPPGGRSGQGVLVRMRDGESVLVGASNPDALCRALASLGVPVDPNLPFAG